MTPIDILPALLRSVVVGVVLIATFLVRKLLLRGSIVLVCESTLSRGVANGGE